MVDNQKVWNYGILVLFGINIASLILNIYVYHNQSSGNWVISGSDNCLVDQDCAMSGGYFSCKGAGTFSLTSRITGHQYFEFAFGCNLNAYGGGGFG